MKKLDFFKYAAVLAAIVLLFVAGCSDDDDSSGELSAPTGKLTERGGDPVSTIEDVDTVIAAITVEFSSGGNYDEDYKDDWGYRINGEIPGGYFLYKVDSKSYSYKETADGATFSGKITIEYGNFSNNGVLYFGGGVVCTGGGYDKQTASVYKEQQEITVNGNINFDGTHKGTLNFQNFKFKMEYESDINYGNVLKDEITIISGKVMLGTFDVTDRFNSDLIGMLFHM